jgi:hypothetical protein
MFATFQQQTAVKRLLCRALAVVAGLAACASGALEATLGTDLANGNFKRLGLAHGQRFAAKGGYLVRLTGEAQAPVRADGPWVVP